jgi:multicomponent Na+:H+ antiporter subunit D
MSGSAAWPLIVVLASAIPSVWVFLLRHDRRRTRVALSLTGAFIKLVAIAVMLFGVRFGRTYELRFPLVPGHDFVLQGDALALLFVTLSAGLWLVTTIYASAYLVDDANQRRFFGFFNLCVSATGGIALAGNLITFLIFYEALTLATYPLVVHYADRKSMAAGRTYLAFTLGGGVVLLFATVWLHSVAGPFSFTPGGALTVRGVDPAQLVPIFALFVLGLGVKTALVPLHPWLPAAMVAPAPVSALLHAVAVVKAGAFGLLRVVLEVFGIGLSAELGVLPPLLVVASVTILYGSLRALEQDELKRLLAYSTVSQLSYIVLGLSIPGPIATLGSLVHLVHQGVMKITLFFCAGIYEKTLGVRRVNELAGVGHRMPLTTIAFTVAALGMIGLPPMAGFISKWLLGVGATTAGYPWVVGVLIASTLLNAAYFLPPVYAAWFRRPDEAAHPRTMQRTRMETRWGLLAPALVTAVITVIVGLLADAPFSVQTWAELVAEKEYAP